MGNSRVQQALVFDSKMGEKESMRDQISSRKSFVAARLAAKGQ